MKRFLLFVFFTGFTGLLLAAVNFTSNDMAIINTIKALIYVIQGIGTLWVIYEGVNGAMVLSSNGEEGKKKLIYAGIAFIVILLLFPAANMITAHAKSEGGVDTSTMDSVLH